MNKKSGFVLALAFIAASFLCLIQTSRVVSAQQGGGAGSQPAYPVTCPANHHMDDLCAKATTERYERFVAFLDTQFNAKVVAAVAQSQNTILNCNGNQQCIDNAKKDLGDYIIYITGNLAQDKINAKNAYEAELIDCCVPNTP